MKENAYEMPWRTNYEAMAAAGWLVGATGAIAAEVLTELPPEPFWWMTGISSGMALYRLPEAYRLYRLQKGLKGKLLAFMELSHLQKVMAKHPDELWLGYGFEWDQRHAQRGRRRKLSATPDHSGKVRPDELSRTQHRRTRHDPGKPLAWHGAECDSPPAWPKPLHDQS